MIVIETLEDKIAYQLGELQLQLLIREKEIDDLKKRIADLESESE